MTIENTTPSDIDTPDADETLPPAEAAAAQPEELTDEQLDGVAGGGFPVRGRNI